MCAFAFPFCYPHPHKRFCRPHNHRKSRREMSHLAVGYVNNLLKKCIMNILKFALVLCAYVLLCG